LTTRRRNLLLLLAIVALAGVGFVLTERSATQRARGPLDAIPQESFLVVTANVSELRASALARPLFAQLLRPDLETCAVDQLLRARDVALAFPEGEGDPALAVEGTFERDALVACAKKVITARGGEARVSQHGKFTVLESREPAHEAPKLALRDGGLLLLGRGPWLEMLMATADGEHPAVTTNPAHTSLRDALSRTGKPQAVLATAVLPQSLRERVKEELGPESGASAGVVAGILGVETAGLAVGAVNGETEAHLALRCETADACIEVKRLVERRRQSLTENPAVRLLGVHALVDALQVEAHGTELSAHTHAPERDVADAVSRLWTFLSPPPPAPPPKPGQIAPAAPPPDEVLRANRGNSKPVAPP
jgi:hypothetical protein